MVWPAYIDQKKNHIFRNIYITLRRITQQQQQQQQQQQKLSLLSQASWGRLLRRIKFRKNP
jgi:hypothetical protein